MQLLRLDVRGVRNLESAVLEPGPHLNLVYGDNGSGKTSLLEAIYLLGRGRSFRSPHINTLVTNGLRKLTVFGEVGSGEADSASTRLGVERDLGGQFRFRIDGVASHSASDLALRLPVIVINAESFSLLEGGPGGRRRYLDWAVFHVEHRSRSVWRNFNRALLQRNSLLRHGKISADELSYWDSQFAALSEQLTQYRRQQFERLKSLTLEEIRTLDGIEGLELSFQQGWEENAELETLLAERLERDKRQRATSAGAHRADIRITINGSPAREVLSRGQMKVVVCGMKLAQARLMRAATGHNPLLLLDDLPAELDASHRQKVLRRLLGEGAQVFVTSVSRDEILSGNHADLGEFDLPLAEDKVKLFHVKHGNITAM